jgi:hypothetical protein
MEQQPTQQDGATAHKTRWSNSPQNKMEQQPTQQDGATAHTTRASMSVLREMFPQNVISRGGDVPWPAHSPDLSAYDYFLRGYLKSRVFSSLSLEPYRN